MEEKGELIQFRFSNKATNFFSIVKLKERWSQIFLTFSEYVNFIRRSTCSIYHTIKFALLLA